MMDRPATIGAATVSAARAPASVRYYLCLALLVGSFITLQTLSRTLSLYFRKEAVPLSKSLQAFDRRALKPGFDLHPSLPPPIEPEVIDTLGTKEYLNLRVVNLRTPRSDPTSVAHVFITYYTGKPDMVPHVPEECYLAGGFDPVGGARAATVGVRGVGAPDDDVPLRIIEFRNRASLLGGGGGERTFSVLYFFHCNGGYYTTRNGVRAALSSLWHRYAYYAKFEINFTDYSLSRFATTEEALEAMGPLLERLMPVIIEEHFGNWERLAGDAEADGAGAAMRSEGDGT